MIIGSINENTNFEKRVAITPDIIKKYKSLGLNVNLSKDYATHLGIKDQEYEKEGATILMTAEEVIVNSNAMGAPCALDLFRGEILVDDSVEDINDFFFGNYVPPFLTLAVIRVIVRLGIRGVIDFLGVRIILRRSIRERIRHPAPKLLIVDGHCCVCFDSQ